MKGRCLILSTLDIKKEQTRFYIYTLSCIIFSFIYEIFSHGVLSYFMILSFIFPLIGLIEIIILKKINIKSHSLFKSSLLTFTLYFILKGILEIYGTTNKLITIYLILGFSLLIISMYYYFKKN